MSKTPVRRLGLAVFVMASLVAGAETVLYVSPDGTGGGTSWEDAAGLEAAVATARAGAGGYELRLKGGLYTPSATVKLSDGISLCGGYTGVGEARDLVNSETIISGDAAKDDVWAHIDGETGKYDFWKNAPYPTTLPKIVVDDKIVVPDFKGQYDTYAPYTTQYAQQPLTNNLARILTIQADATCTVDGLTLACGGTGGWKNYSDKEDGYALGYGSCLLVSDGATATISNCRVVASCAQNTVVYFGGTSAKPSTVAVTGLTVANCRTCCMAALSMTDSAQVTIEGSLFSGNAHVGEYYTKNFYFKRGHAVALKVGAALTKLIDTAFERTVELKNGWYQQDHDCAAVLWLPYDGALRTDPDKLKNLRFVNNASYCGEGRPFPIVWLDQANIKLTGCLFQNNLCTSKSVNDGRTDSDVGSIINMPTAIHGSGYDADLVLLGSTVVSNKIVITPATGITAIYAAPVLTRGFGYVVNCTFSDNTVTLSKTAPGGCLVSLSRALMSVKVATDKPRPMWIHAENCTFAGATALPDVVDAGETYERNRSFVGNSILWATGAGADVARVQGFGAGAGNGVELGRCIVRRPDLLVGTPAVKVTDAIYGEDPLLEPLAYLNADDPVPVIRCGARPPALNASYDVRFWIRTTYSQYLYRYGYGIGSGTFRDRLDNEVKASDSLISDALGNARPAGGFTLGALQATAADDKATFVVRPVPAAGGTVDGATAPVTVVADIGTAGAVCTAAANPGYTFHAWRSCGAELSKEAAYAPTAAVAGSYYADATFLPDDKTITVQPGDDLQLAIDTLALCDGPATLVLSAGRYPIFESLVVRQKKPLTVKGDGTAILSGDPSGLAYWVNNAGTAKTAADGSKLRVFEEDGTFNEPCREDGELFWKTAVPGSALRTTYVLDMTSGLDDAGAGTTLVFSNVTFALGQLLVASAETTFDHCRILAAGTSADSPIIDCWTNITLVGTSFVANYGKGIYSGDNIVSTYTKSHVCLWTARDCEFRLNAGGAKNAGPCLNGFNADPLVVGTLFSSNVVSTTTASSLVFGRDLTTGVIRDSTFSDNLYTNTTATLLYAPYAGSLTVSNCCFRGNRQYNSSFPCSEKTSAAGRTCAWGALLASKYKPIALYDSSFLSNLVDVTGTPAEAVTNAIAAIVGCLDGTTLVNSHFEGNVARVHAPERDGLTVRSACYLAQNKNRYAFTGNSFYNNDADVDLFVVRYSRSYDWNCVNCIFWNDDSGYVPFAWADASLDAVNFWNCVIRNAPDNAQGEAESVVRYYGVRSTDPMFGPLVWQGGVCCRALTPGSSAVHHGTEVGYNGSGTRIFYRSDAKAWRQCANPGSDGGTLVADAADMFGTYARSLAHPDIGPVQQTVPPSGMLMIVR